MLYKWIIFAEPMGELNRNECRQASIRADFQGAGLKGPVRSDRGPVSEQ